MTKLKPHYYESDNTHVSLESDNTQVSLFIKEDLTFIKVTRPRSRSTCSNVNENWLGNAGKGLVLTRPGQDTALGVCEM